jgi:hypothetical protein
MTDVVERVLRLVADGHLSADEAEPILDALADRDRMNGPGAPSPAANRRGRYARIEVSDGGRSAVDLRIPLALGELALGRIPGLSREDTDRVRAAIDAGVTGPVLAVTDEDGDGVRIIIE